MKIALKYKMGLIYFLISGILAIMFNLGKRDPNTLSAYSIFNKNYERIPGTLTSDNFDSAFGHIANQENDDQIY